MSEMRKATAMQTKKNSETETERQKFWKELRKTARAKLDPPPFRIAETIKLLENLMVMIFPALKRSQL